MRSERIRLDSARVCPVSDMMMARIYSAGPDKLIEIVRGLPETLRASLAAFCYMELHLRDTARRIAAVCDPVALARSRAHPGLAVLIADEDTNYVKPKITSAPDSVVREWAAIPY